VTTALATIVETLEYRVRAALGGVSLALPTFPGEVRVEVPPERLVATCAAIGAALHTPLATMVGCDDRARSGAFRLNYVFGPPGGWVTVETAIDPAEPRFPAVTPALPAAHWYEREVQDLLGLTAVGHPDPRPLVLHDDWPSGVYPLRKDFDPAAAVPRVPRRDFRPPHLRGEGLIEIPVGPIHAGIIEPAHFRIAALGEVVLNIDARLFYTHRGLEKLAEGQTADRTLQIAERISGVCALSHAVSYCQAVETLAEVAIPPRAAAIRTLCLELERLYNHVGDLGNLCAGTGFAIGTSQGLWLKEELQRLNERLFGHRFLRGVCRIGGVRRDLDSAAAAAAVDTLRGLFSSFQRFVELFTTTDSFTERMHRTGVVPTVAARDLGAVGVAARASGLDVDARRDHPHAAYPGLRVPVVVKATGDVRARADVRLEEAFNSFRLAREILSTLPAGPLAVEVGAIPPDRTALGVTESVQGENIHWVRTDGQGRIDRYRIRAAAYCNWPVVALAVPGNMVPDFPLINKSFELSYACCDR
jgi:Ni,Fe-hydrogenase III large subunit/Ni,Fe-hydrogenase III component G